MRCLILFLILLPQDADLASKLKSGGWAAVDELGAKPEMKSAIAELAGGKDVEVAWWAGAALDELEAREKAGDAYLPPLRITLEAKDRSAGELLRELMAKAKGRPIDLPEGDHPITVSFRDTSYLEAIDEVCRLAGLVLARGAGGRLQAVPAEPGHGPRFYHAGFAASVVSLVQRTDVTFREEPASQLHLTISLRADPRLRILDEEVTCALSRAEDDTGRSLLKEGAKPTIRIRGPAEGGAVGQLALAVPAGDAKKIALLRGSATLTLAKKVEEIVFENVSKNGTQDRESGGVKASLKSVTREGEEIRLELELSAKDRVFWPSTDNLSLEDGEGSPYQKWGSSMNSSGTSASYRLNYRDRNAQGPPEKFRISVVTETYPRQVRFEIKDLVLR
jgi:hypothetical protein